jgi:predicted helicase
MGSSFVVVNEPEHIDCGAPDLVIQKSGIPVAYIETKNIGDGDLDGLRKNKEQFDRYKAGLDTIVFTDYLDFHLYKDEKLQLIVHLAFVQNDKIVLNEGAVKQFQALLDKLLYETKAQSITSPKKLAVLMANKAKLIAEVIKLNLQKSPDTNLGLAMQMQAFKNILNKDIDEEKFADLYAQTIAYGLFVARIHDNKKGEFTREKAMKLIPQTNPFLRELFQYIAGINIRKSIAWIVDDLVTIFEATNVEKLRKNFEKEFQRRDPMIHFYEDFLFQYNPAAKKKYGVYYTPQPVVEFIVRAVDDILKNEFDIADGLADTGMVNNQHRVQILDPATGTGTFLAEVVGRIKEQIQPAIWPIYVREHLLPRIYGFEYMMAPYTIAHIKLDMLINLWGKDKVADDTNERVKVYLTNSLIQDDLKTKIAFAEMLAKEANEANDIKQKAPVMVMLGNPPYNVKSTNKGEQFEWIETKLKDYKKNLKEKKLNLDDDYIKFIRLAQYYVERTGEGIVAYISNNSFIDGLTHRQMRRELMRCFDDIYVLNLHGDSYKQETSTKGENDENVFDIRQGVSINIFIKKKHSIEQPATIHHYDLFGTRIKKYEFLMKNTLASINWTTLQPIEPNLLFVPVDYSEIDEYEKGFKIDELMRVSNSGVQTDRDPLFIDKDAKVLASRIKTLFSYPLEKEFVEKFNVKNSSSYNLIQKILSGKYDSTFVRQYIYRPFDMVNIYYDRNVISRPAYDVMQHLLHKNIALLVKRGFPMSDRPQGFVTECLSDRRAWSCSGMQGAESVFPLYLYPSESELGFDSKPKPNLDETIWRAIENRINCGQDTIGSDAAPEEHHYLTPEDIFDYIYGVLHSPHYREKYKEFLKVDFPRIPYPKNAAEFEHYKDCGHRLRELHLMHNVPKSNVVFEGNGNFEIKKIRWDDNRVYINDTQFFSNVPKVAWEMYIGGYQPAQKWLKDRKDRSLSTMEILHYENIITILLATKETMDKMDDPSAQVDELKKKVANLEHQLQESQKSAQIINYGTINNDNSKHITIK